MQIAPFCFQKYIIISVGWLLICIVLQTGKKEIEQDNLVYNQYALIMGTAFICVLTEFKQEDRCSHSK